ncbi:hypothetical protein EGW08_003732, partial [Elysia chlorotica]
MASWTKDATIQFIEVYRSMECLWKIKSKEYSNKFLKEKAYEKLIEISKQFDPTTNKDSVCKKINNLRSAFKRELKKCEVSKLSGAGTDEIYEPKLWYFENLMFLRDQEIPRAARSNIEPLNRNPEIEEELLPPDTPSHTPTVPVSESAPASSASEVLVLPQPSPARSTGLASAVTTPNVAGKKKNTGRKRNSDEELLGIARARLLHPQMPPSEDQYDAFGKNVAHRLRNLPNMQRIYAQKIISDILFEAEVGNLT